VYTYISFYKCITLNVPRVIILITLYKPTYFMWDV